LLFQLLAVPFQLLTYCLYVRKHPRIVAGVILALATLTMTASTILIAYCRDRRLRRLWLLLGVLGCAASLWRLGSIDSLTSKGQPNAGAVAQNSLQPRTRIKDGSTFPGTSSVSGSRL
jgi:hypothetical protein